MMKSARIHIVLITLLLSAASITAGEDKTPPLAIQFYFQPGCPHCKKTRAAIHKAESRFGDRIRITRIDLNVNDKVFTKYIALLDRHGIQDTPNLAVIIGDRHLTGEAAIIDTLEVMIEEILQKGSSPMPPRSRTPEKINRTTFVMVSVAALIDGLNPCAFATIILFFFLFYSVGHTRKTIVMVGVSFLAGVFVCYLAIGLLFYRAMAALKHIHLLAGTIQWIAIGMVTVAGALSLVDALRAYRMEGRAPMLLVLPDWLKRLIRKRLTGVAHSGGLLWTAFTAGLIVSLFESACTGQMYFPLLQKLAYNRGTMMQGIGLLLWYNLLFLTPLIAVLMLALLGISIEQIASFSRKRVWITKLGLGVVFIGMAVWLLRG